MELSKLPPLPQGWHYEQNLVLDHVVHVVWPEHGGYSVDTKERSIEPGFTLPRSCYRVPGTTGRGWKERLIGQAVLKLMATWNDTGEGE